MDTFTLNGEGNSCICDESAHLTLQEGEVDKCVCDSNKHYVEDTVNGGCKCDVNYKEKTDEATGETTCVEIICGTYAISNGYSCECLVGADFIEGSETDCACKLNEHFIEGTEEHNNDYLIGEIVDILKDASEEKIKIVKEVVKTIVNGEN